MIEWVLLAFSLVTIGAAIFLMLTQQTKTVVPEDDPNNVKSLPDVTRGSAHKVDIRTSPFDAVQIATGGSLSTLQAPLNATNYIKHAANSATGADFTGDGPSGTVAQGSKTVVPNPLYERDTTTFGGSLLIRDELYVTSPTEGFLLKFSRETNGTFKSDDPKIIDTKLTGKSPGTIGPKALAISDDGLRLYVGQDGTPGPFLQNSGAIAILEREEVSADFVFKQTLDNPFGGQIPQFSSLKDPFYPGGPSISGDGFGRVIQSSVNSRAENYELAVTGNFTGDKNSGRFVAVYQENKDGNMILDQVILAPDSVDKNVFAWDIALFDDFLFASVPESSGFKVLVFQRQSDDTWALKSTLASPNDAEYFGYSLTVDPVLGNWLIIGSPTKLRSSGATYPTGQGGSVYSYLLNKGNGTVTLVDTISAPASSSTRAFGVAVNLDVTARAVVISGNVDMTVRTELKTPVQNGDSSLPNIYVYTIDPKLATFGSVSVVSAQKLEGNTLYADPTFGFLSGTSINGDTLTLSLPSMLNGEVELATVSLDN